MNRQRDREQGGRESGGRPNNRPALRPSLVELHHNLRITSSKKLMDSSSAIPLAPTKAGRVSGKNWKGAKTPTVRSNLPRGVKSKSWEDRKRKDTQLTAVKALEKELKDEKAAELARRREVTKERKDRVEEKRRLEEMKAKMSAKKLARVRRRQGRTKKING